MNKDKARDPLSQKILDLTLEIIFLLTGEGHMVVKINEMVTDSSRHQISEGGYCRTQSFNTELPPHSGIHQQNNEKILELTNKIIRLLTGEIPIRCEDVSVYLSMEEWEYVERHKDLYKYVMMEDHQPIVVLGKSVSGESHTPVSFSDFGTEYIPSGGKKYLNKARKWRVESVTSTEAEPLTVKEGYFPEKDIYPNTEYTEYFPVVIKEEPVSSEEENLTDTDLYKPTEHTPDKSEEYLKDNTNLMEINPSESLIESIKPNQSLYYTGLIYDPVYAGNSVPPSEMGNISTFETDLLKNETNCGEEPISSTASGESSTTEPASKYQNVYTEEQFSCPECEKYFTNNFALKKHQRIHKRKIPFKCPECGKCFDRSSDLARHEMVHTGEKTLKFSECEKGFTAPSHLATHKWIYTGEKTFKCLECGKWFSRSSSLARHKMIHKCTECGECFTVASSNARHKTIHIGEKTFKCLKCGKDFIQASNLAVHKLIHTREKTFNCTECGKWFSRSSNLAAHKMIHTGVKPFNCSECEKGFTAASHLAIHKRIHTGERPFKCLKCGKGFSQASNLEAHKMIHTREKPFNCTECGKWFSRSSNLTAHKMIHTGVKPFKCTECEKGFTVASQLAKHKKIHTGEKPCKCTECGNCFALATTLTKHKRTHT